MFYLKGFPPIVRAGRKGGKEINKSAPHLEASFHFQIIVRWFSKLPYFYLNEPFGAVSSSHLVSLLLIQVLGLSF